MTSNRHVSNLPAWRRPTATSSTTHHPNTRGQMAKELAPPSSAKPCLAKLCPKQSCPAKLCPTPLTHSRHSRPRSWAAMFPTCSGSARWTPALLAPSSPTTPPTSPSRSTTTSRPSTPTGWLQHPRTGTTPAPPCNATWRPTTPHASPQHAQPEQPYATTITSSNTHTDRPTSPTCAPCAATTTYSKPTQATASNATKPATSPGSHPWEPDAPRHPKDSPAISWSGSGVAPGVGLEKLLE